MRLRFGSNVPQTVVSCGTATACSVLLAIACEGADPEDLRGAAPSGAVESEARLARARERMVDDQLVGRDLRDERVLGAMRRVPRHRFAPDVDPIEAYEDRPHPIGEGQTISQPYIVALMTELARVEPPCKVLEVGTGSGYQAAVLAELGCTVYSIEIVESLARRAERLLGETGYGDRVHVRFGDGYRGWPEQAPFDAILVTAAAPRLPDPLLEQLGLGARLVIPVGEMRQELEVHRRTERGFEHERVTGVRFVPMTGEVRR